MMILFSYLIILHKSVNGRMEVKENHNLFDNTTFNSIHRSFL